MAGSDNPRENVHEGKECLRKAQIRALTLSMSNSIVFHSRDTKRKSWAVNTECEDMKEHTQVYPHPVGSQYTVAEVGDDTYRKLGLLDSPGGKETEERIK